VTILKAAKLKLITENGLLESTSSWIKSELQIEPNPGQLKPALNNRAMKDYEN